MPNCELEHTDDGVGYEGPLSSNDGGEVDSEKEVEYEGESIAFLTDFQ